MGCSGYSVPNSQTLSEQQKILHHSILLKKKKSRKSKKNVRFEISYTNFKHLSIPDEPSTPWYESIPLSDYSEWKIFKSNKNVSLKYFIKGNKLQMRLSVLLTVNIGHEAILYLINNPKYRAIWDTNIQKFDLLFGDNNLDAFVVIVDSGKSQLLERKVRRFKGDFYVTYVSCDDEVEKDFMITAIKAQEEIVVVWVEEASEEFEKTMERKFLWGNRLFEEILVHKNN